jgi:hypothetical protein
MLNEVRLRYSVFGLILGSNLPIPVLPLFDGPRTDPDIKLHLGISPFLDRSNSSLPEEISYVSAVLNESGKPALCIWKAVDGSYLRLEFPDGMQCWLDHNHKNLWVLWPEASSIEHAVSYLLGPVLGILLRYRGVTCLHASAVAVGDKAVAFVGAAGAGKSTIAAALARRGFPVLSDDIVPLEDREGAFYVNPAYPHLWLWPESVELLYGSREALPRPIPNWEKQRFPLASEGTRFEKRALPLSRIYILGERCAGTPPYVEAVPPQTVLMSLVADTYATNILDREMRAKEFRLLGRLVSYIPVRRLHAQQDPPGLTELCDVLCEDFGDREIDQSVSLGTSGQNRPV